MNAGPFVGLVGFVVIVAILGGLAVIGISNTDLANFNTSAAEARAIDKQTDFNAQKAEIDLHAYQQSVELKTQVEIEKANADLAYQKQKNTLELEKMAVEQQHALEKQRLQDQAQVEFGRVLAMVAVVTGSLAILMVFGGLSFLIIRFARSHYPISNHADLWHTDKAWRKSQIAQARLREQEKRSAVCAKPEHLVANENYTKLFQGKLSNVPR